MKPIVFLHASAYCAGAERSLLELVSGLKARGHLIEVWNSGENPELGRWLEEAGVPWRSLPAPKYGSRDLLGYLHHGLVLMARWIRRRPRLVHANNLSSAKYAAQFAALLRLPLVCHWRDGPTPDALTSRLLGKASLVLAISEFIARQIGTIPGTPVKVLYNATDVLAITPAPPPAAPDEPLRFVTPAAYRPDKRIDLVLKTAALLRDAGCRFHWRVCGPRPEEAYFAGIEEEHARLGLADHVSLEPSLPQEEVYGGANVVVSTSGGEPFGRTVIEGYARGLPVVGFASGALPELIVPGETGLLARDGDARALADALGELEADRDRVLELGRAGRELAERRFSLATLLDAVEAHHDSIC